MIRRHLDCFKNWWLIVQCNTLFFSIVSPSRCPGTHSRVLGWALLHPTVWPQAGHLTSLGRCAPHCLLTPVKHFDNFGQKSSAFVWMLLYAGSVAKRKTVIIKQGLSLPLGYSKKKKDEHLKILEEMFSGRLSHVKEGKWKQRGNTPNRNRKEICVLRLPFLCQDFRDAGLLPLTIP